MPRLPVFQREEQQSPESQIRSTQATLSSFPAAADSQSACGHRESSKEQEGKKEGVDTVDHSSSSSQENSQRDNKKMMARLMEDSAEEDEDDEYDQVCMNPGASKLDVEGAQGRMPQSLYDHLELRSNSGTPRLSPVPSPSPENLSRSNTPRPPASWPSKSLHQALKSCHSLYHLQNAAASRQRFLPRTDRPSLRLRALPGSHWHTSAKSRWSDTPTTTSTLRLH